MSNQVADQPRDPSTVDVRYGLVVTAAGAAVVAMILVVGLAWA